jgi:hypothetical protein
LPLIRTAPVYLLDTKESVNTPMVNSPSSLRKQDSEELKGSDRPLDPSCHCDDRSPSGAFRSLGAAQIPDKKRLVCHGADSGTFAASGAITSNEAP